MGERTSALFRSGASARSNLHSVNWHEYDAALFDLDGVLTPTAEVHMRAWQQLFVDFLSRRGIDEPYVASDYFDYALRRYPRVPRIAWRSAAGGRSERRSPG